MASRREITRFERSPQYLRCKGLSQNACNTDPECKYGKNKKGVNVCKKDPYNKPNTTSSPTSRAEQTRIALGPDYKMIGDVIQETIIVPKPGGGTMKSRRTTPKYRYAFSNQNLENIWQTPGSAPPFRSGPPPPQPPRTSRPAMPSVPMPVLPTTAQEAKDVLGAALQQTFDNLTPQERKGVVADINAGVPDAQAIAQQALESKNPAARDSLTRAVESLTGQIEAPRAAASTLVGVEAQLSSVPSSSSSSTSTTSRQKRGRETKSGSSMDQGEDGGSSGSFEEPALKSGRTNAERFNQEFPTAARPGGRASERVRARRSGQSQGQLIPE